MEKEKIKETAIKKKKPQEKQLNILKISNIIIVLLRKLGDKRISFQTKIARNNLLLQKY